MADLSFSNTPILGDLYDNAQDALNRSIQLGCSGYRTYYINGQTKYVPCSSFIEYEKTLRYRVEQGKLAAFGSDVFGDKLVGLQFANSKSEIDKGDPFFTLGNFSISRSVVTTNTNNVLSQPDSGKKYTIDSIKKSVGLDSTDIFSKVTQTVQQNLRAKVLFDKQKLENYVRFSSLTEGFKNSILEITKDYPGAIKLTPISILNPAVTKYTSYASENKASFKVNIKNINNPFGIDYFEKSKTKIDDTTISILRNFGKTYTDYVIYYNGIEYPIIDVTLPVDENDTATGLVITTVGQPFLDKMNTNNEANVLFYIKPAQTKYDQFINNLSELSKFLLTWDPVSKTYKSTFKRPQVDESGNYVLVNKTIYFPMSDSVNIDLFDDKFDEFLTTLNDISNDYDTYKTNLISRFLTTDSLHEFDTQDKKMELVFQMYGRIFDEVLRYIDGLSYMTNLSYDRVENVPDVLVKNFASMLGFNATIEEDVDSMLTSLFTTTDTKSPTITPAELDIELWRRIAINAFYLFKSKGTRKSIDFILRLVGVPDYILDINEYIYLADNPVDPINKLNQIYQSTNIIDPLSLLGRYPFDADGFPTVPSTVAYQENGGYFTQNSENIGPYDFGKKYVNAYTNFDGVSGFRLFKTIDNVKSWVESQTPRYNSNDEVLRSTYYYEEDSRLTINSKELEVFLSLDRIMDYSVYRYFANNNIDIDTNLFSGYTQTIQPNKITFNQYVRQVLSEYIQVENRKTITTYPTLTKIYFDFLRLSNNYVSYDKGLDFLNKFDTHWVKLVQQFTPATSIINSGKKLRNSIHNDNKFVYKQGLNDDVSWLGTVGSEFQTKAKKPVYQGQTDISTNNGLSKPGIVGVFDNTEIVGSLGNRIMGLDPTINEYYGSYYSNFDFCNSDYNAVIWQPTIDYTTTGYSGNIVDIESNTYVASSLLYNSDVSKLRRYGVFVIYNGQLFRMNTLASIIPKNTPFDSTSLTHTQFLVRSRLRPISYEFTYSGETYAQRPNIAKSYIKYSTGTTVYFTYSGTPLYTHIPRNVDAKNISFPDCDGVTNASPNQVEKEYFFKSISMAFAYMDLRVNFVCPPPKPHVCYFDYSGNTINLNFNSSLLTAYPLNATYIDDHGITRTVKQPIYYGYSKYTSTNRPNLTDLGRSGQWTAPYVKRQIWSSGTIYYKGELIKYLPTPNVTYVVTGVTATGTSTTPVISTTSGLSYSTYLVGDMYANYSGRTKTDPLMHVEPAYIDKRSLLLKSPVTSINLTKSLNLDYIFSGATRDTTYLVENNVIGNQLYVSDSLNLSFDGFYPVKTENVGPFYIPRTEDVLIHTLDEELELVPDQSNYVSIQSLNTNFTLSGNDLNLVESNPGFYLITKNSYLKFDLQLYLTTEYFNDQNVKVRLMTGMGAIVNEQEFTISGAHIPEENVVNFIFEGFFTANTKVYLVIEPVTLGCKLERYEKIDYVFNEPNRDFYDPLDDGRFRLMFNSGRKVMYGTELEYGLSISPLIGKYDTQTGTTQSFVTVDNYIYEDNRPGTNHYYLNVPRLKYTQSTDPTRIFNKLYLSYYQKFHNDLYLTDNDKMLFDKDIKYDKVNFSFNVKTKKLPYEYISADTFVSGQIGVPLEYTISGSDYFLGNVPEFYEGASVTNNILLGKNIGRRSYSVENIYPYIPSRSALNGVSALGTGNTFNYQYFQAFNSGLLDYTQLDLNNPSTIYNNRRVIITGSTYQLENEVYDNELYQSILSSVEKYNNHIINYQVNDMVKFTISNYKKVVPTSTGYSIQTVNVDRVYVCTQDITTNHCLKYVSGTTTYPYAINPIYEPLGLHSCFHELVKYDPKNYSPWGYERFYHYKINQTNIYPYTNVENRQYVETGDTLNLNWGNIVTYKDSIYRFIYNKPLPWYTGQTGNYNGQYWNKYDLVSRKVGNNTLIYKNQRNNAPFVLTEDPSASPYHWSLLSTGTTSTNVGNPFNFHRMEAFTSPSGLYHNNANAVIRLPNLMPTDTLGNVIGWKITGDTGTPDYNIYTTPVKNNIIGKYPVYLDVSSINNNYNDINILNYYRLDSLSDGDTIMIPGAHPITGGYNPTSQVLNVYYYPLASEWLEPYDYNSGTPTGIFESDIFNKNYSPIFEWLCYANSVQCPRDFQTTRSYYNSSNYLIDRYAVSRGIVYRNLSSTGTTFSDLPFQDENNWEKADFCLVDTFTFHKDRTKVSVFESDIYSLTDDVKNNLFFYKNNLLLKNGFTVNSFSGTTTNGVINKSIDGKLKSGLDTFFDSTDTNKRSVTSYGTYDFRKVNNDLIMDYYYAKDSVGLPLTGEFIGKLSVTDPCGNSATGIIGLLFDTDIAQLTTIAPNYTMLTGESIASASALKYNVRLMTKQMGTNTVKISWTTNTGDVFGSYTVNSGVSYDNTLSVLPGTTLTIVYEYDRTNNSTMYDDGYFNVTPLYDKGNNGLDTLDIQTNTKYVNMIEYRTVVISNIKQNNLVTLNVKGLSGLNTNDYKISNQINL